MRASSRTDANLDTAKTFASAREDAMKALKADNAPAQAQPPRQNYSSEVCSVPLRSFVPAL